MAFVSRLCLVCVRRAVATNNGESKVLWASRCELAEVGHDTGIKGASFLQHENDLRMKGAQRAAVDAAARCRFAKHCSGSREDAGEGEGEDGQVRLKYKCRCGGQSTS